MEITGTDFQDACDLLSHEFQVNAKGDVFSMFYAHNMHKLP